MKHSTKIETVSTEFVPADISKALVKYTKAGSVKFIKKSTPPNSFYIVVNSITYRSDGNRIKNKIRNAGYVVTRVRTGSSFFIHGFRPSLGRTCKSPLYTRVFLSVAPKPPVSPPPFSDPDGKESNNSKNEKG